MIFIKEELIMKKIIALVLCLLMTLSLVSCGSKESSESAPSSGTTSTSSGGAATSSEPEKLMKEPLVLKFCCSESEDSLMYVEMKKAFDNIAERTNGEITIEGYPNNQLGSINDMTEQLMSGAPLIVPIGFDNVASFVENFDVAGFNYIYNDIYEVYALAKSDWMAEQETKMLAAGVTPVAYAAYGYRNWIGTFPVETAADIKGHIVRMSPAVSRQNFISVMGGTPTTSTWADNYSLIQTGVIEACEASIDLLWSSSLQEVCQYLNLSEHDVTPIVVFVSTQYWDQIPAEYQEILSEELQAAEIAATDAAMEQYDSFIEKFKEAGITIVETDKSSFAPYISELLEVLEIDVELYNTIRSEIEANM